jgi:hypothetical protein
MVRHVLPSAKTASQAVEDRSYNESAYHPKDEERETAEDDIGDNQHEGLWVARFGHRDLLRTVGMISPVGPTYAHTWRKAMEKAHHSG